MKHDLVLKSNQSSNRYLDYLQNLLEQAKAKNDRLLAESVLRALARARESRCQIAELMKQDFNNAC